MNFDLELFEALNDEYRTKPIHRPRSNESENVQQRGRGRAAWLAKQFGVAGKRCLEIGCGRGEVVTALAKDYGVEALGVDVETYSEWERAAVPGARMLQRDISSERIDDLGRFDLIFSFSVWEHVRKPFEALRAAKQLLSPGGDLYLSVNLHRGSQASHRYREVFFPWPHLLFDDSVFEAFYARRGRPGTRSAWVNRLSAAEYHAYFEALGLSVIKCSYTHARWDEEFYRRFEDILGRYPREDLARDFLKVHLRHTAHWRRMTRRLLRLEPAQLTTRLGQLARRASERLSSAMLRGPRQD